MLEPYWWAKDWTDEEKRLAGDPAGRIVHMRKISKSVDRFEKRIDKQLAKEYFNPTAAK